MQRVFSSLHMVAFHLCFVALTLGTLLARANGSESMYAGDPRYASTPPTPHKVFTIGYLRMSGVDDSSILAGFMATIREANIKNNKDFAPEKSHQSVFNRRDRRQQQEPPALGFTIKLDVVTIACPNILYCAGALASIDVDYVTPEIESMALRYNKTYRDSLSDVNLASLTLNLTSTKLPDTDTDGEKMLLAFFARMPFYSAVMRPNYILAPRIIAHARRLGVAMYGTDSPDFAEQTINASANYFNYLSSQRKNTTQSSYFSTVSASGQYLPVVLPITIAAKDYQPGSENLVHFEHYITNQLSHIFTFMQQAAGCAISGIIFQQFSEMAHHVDFVKDLFADGGLPIPPSLNIESATDQDLLDFFLGDERRRCFIVMATNFRLNNVVERLVKSANGSFIPKENKFFGTTLLSTPRFKLSNGETNVYDVHYTRWSPQYVSSDPNYQIEAAADLDVVFNDWYTDVINNSDANASYFDTIAAGNITAFVSFVPIEVNGSGSVATTGFDISGFDLQRETIPTRPTDNMLAAFLAMRLVVDTIRSAVGKIGHSNLFPPPAAEMLANDTLHNFHHNSPYDANLTMAYMMFASDRIEMGADGATPVVSVVLPHWSFIDTCYSESRTFSGYALYRLQRECISKPFPGSCYCNTAPRTSYIYFVDSAVNNNSMNGYPAVRYDDVSRGQKSVATLSISATCSYSVSSWSYPISALFILPAFTTEILATAVFTETFGEMTRAANYAPNPPARAFRYVPFTIDAGDSTARVLQSYTASYNPFVIYGSIESNIQQATVLTLYPALRFEMEDPPLRPMMPLEISGNGTNVSANLPPSLSSNFWQPNLLKLQPVLADYIHSLASYYKDNADTLFNGMPLRAIATTRREAELISLSLGTFGYLMPVETIVVSTDPLVWDAKLSEWLSAEHASGYSFSAKGSASASGGGSRQPTEESKGFNGSAFGYRLPFVIAASTANTNRVIFKAVSTAKTIDNGVLGVATGDTTMYNATLVNENITTDKNTSSSTSLSPSSSTPIPPSVLADVIFGAMAPEWWVPNTRRYQGVPPTLLEKYRGHPRIISSVIAFEFAQSLALHVQEDYLSTAADILYATSPTIGTRAGTFGPFSNTSCTRSEIGRNARDRQCQCTKGPRSMWVHSLKSRELGSYSYRTNQYAYTMATCGVDYQPYVAPPTPAAALLSSAGIAGVATGGSIAIIGLIVAAIVVNAVFFGRNNRAAPKDSTQPFAVVFTDIQSSTALWARAPLAMSEAIEDHHRILRKAIRRNDGYEVKTVGDSFMVAFKDVDDAVRFSLDAQHDLKNATCWGTEIDAIYLELIAEAESTNADETDDRGGLRTDGRGTITDYESSNHHVATSTVYTTNNNNNNRALANTNNTNNNNNNNVTAAANPSGVVPFDGNSSSCQSASYPFHYAAANGGNVSTTNAVSTFNNVSLANHQAGSPAQSFFTVQSPPRVMKNNNNQTNNNVALFATTFSSGNQQQQQGGLATITGTTAMHTVQSVSESLGDLHSGGAVDIAVQSVHPASISGGLHQQCGVGASSFIGNMGNNNNNNANNIAAETSCLHLSQHGGGDASTGVVVPPLSSRATLKSSSCASPASPIPQPGTTSDSRAILVDALEAGAQRGVHNGFFDPVKKQSATEDAFGKTMPTTTEGNHVFTDDEVLVGFKKIDPVAWQKSAKDKRLSFDKNNNNNNNNNCNATATYLTSNDSEYTMLTEEEIATNKKQWHGLRVRIGVHYGMGDIRKDPVTLGYDYYGTVVNTAARVEGVGHGGQILVTEEAFSALSDGFVGKNKAIAIALGPQPLRGLDEPIKLHQLCPLGLEGRRFPPLRLHVEKESEETDLTDTATTNTNSTENATPEELAEKLCSGRQFAGITADNLILQYYFFLATFAPTTEKYKAGVVAKLGEAWGFEKASKAAHVSNEGHRTRLLVGLLGKIIRTFRASKKAKGARHFAGGVGGGGGRDRGLSNSSAADEVLASAGGHGGRDSRVVSIHNGGGFMLNSNPASNIQNYSNNNINNRSAHNTVVTIGNSVANNNNNNNIVLMGHNNNNNGNIGLAFRAQSGGISTSLSVSPQPSRQASRCATPSFTNGAVGPVVVQNNNGNQFLTAAGF